MDIITSTQDIHVGNEILLLCKGEAFKFELTADKNVGLSAKFFLS